MKDMREEVVGRKKEGSENRGLRHKAWLAVLLLVVAGLAAYLMFGWRDPRARKGYYEGKTPEEIRDDLDSQVEWNAMEISCASHMEIEEGQTLVDARIENVQANHCDQRVRMYVSGHPEDVLFESGAIAPGEYLQQIELAHSLPVGRNNVTFEFQGYERLPSFVSDEGQFLGHDRFGASAMAEVTIDVLPSGA